MANSRRVMRREGEEGINVSAFKSMQIRFPGDVYLLAVWIALCDRARSTSTSQTHTTLNGLAKAFEAMYGIDYRHPLHSDDVIAVFRRYGIKGNPTLHLDEEGETSLTISLV